MVGWDHGHVSIRDASGYPPLETMQVPRCITAGEFSGHSPEVGKQFDETDFGVIVDI